jgi:lipoate synthase
MFWCNVISTKQKKTNKQPYFIHRLDIINFMEIKILSPNTKSETQNKMQRVLQKHTLHTCCESAQSGPTMCFHLEPSY